jgi:hypothetical protein
MGKSKRINGNKALIESLIGKSLEEVIDIASSNGYETRILREDSENYYGTFDLNFWRINLEIDNKKVTKASIG